MQSKVKNELLNINSVGKKELYNDFNTISEIAKKNNNLYFEEYSVGDLLELDAIFMKLALYCKRALENKSVTNEEEVKNYFDSEEEMEMYYRKMKSKQRENEEKILHNLPVEIKFDGEIFIAKTPYVFKRGYGGDYSHVNYCVAEMVKLAIKNWLERNEKDDLDFDNLTRKRTLIILRRSKKFTIGSICDNDNIEAGRIVNAICDAFCISDNAKQLDHVIKYEKCDNESKNGTYFILMDTETYNNEPLKYMKYI